MRVKCEAGLHGMCACAEECDRTQLRRRVRQLRWEVKVMILRKITREGDEGVTRLGRYA